MANNLKNLKVLIKQSLEKLETVSKELGKMSSDLENLNGISSDVSNTALKTKEQKQLNVIDDDWDIDMFCETCEVYRAKFGECPNVSMDELNQIMEAAQKREKDKKLTTVNTK